MKRNLAIIFGGRSGEHEVSLQSARAIMAAVDRLKFNVMPVAIDKSGNWYLCDESRYLDHADDPAKISLVVNDSLRIALIPHNGGHKLIKLINGDELHTPDVVFPIIHGTFGEDGALQGYLAMLNIPYVGADILGSSVGMDKIIAKQLLEHHEIPVAPYRIAHRTTDRDQLRKEVEDNLGYPVFVKPSCSGSSVGVYKVESPDELNTAVEKALAFDRRVLIEKAIAGREIECAVLGNEDLKISVPGEVIPRHAFYSYEAKYIDAEGARLDYPADLSEEEILRVQELSVRTYKALSCCGMARVDMFLQKDGALILNEINTLPGFTRISMYPKLMALSGLDFGKLIDRLVDLAMERHQEQAGFLSNILSARVG